MKVFVAGATGAIGKPLISALVAAHHAVVGMTSSARGLSVLQNYGADGVIVDAAAATVAAIESDPGVYNVVDNVPSEMRVWLPAFTSFAGAPVPPHISKQEAQSLGPGVLYYATRLRGARNDLAKQKLGFSPRRLEWLSKASRAV